MVSSFIWVSLRTVNDYREAVARRLEGLAKRVTDRAGAKIDSMEGEGRLSGEAGANRVPLNHPDPRRVG